MGTWTDRQRGERQGRIEPAVITPPDGTHTFVLGSIDDAELAALSPGDYAEVRQTVDLTDVDLVSATMDTIGQLASQFQGMAGWEDDSDTIFLYNFNSNQRGDFHGSTPGFPLVGEGEIEVGVEAYSPDATNCRVIPPGSVAALESALNDPQIFPTGPGVTWAFEQWLNFDSDAHPTSWGIHPILFHCREQVNKSGLQISLSGASGGGAHQWTFAVSQWNSIRDSDMQVFLGYIFDTPSPGWHLFGIVYDFYEPAASRLKLYCDGAYVGVSLGSPSIYMDQPPGVGSPFQIGDPLLRGAFDATRLRSIAPKASEMLASYNECVIAPPAVDFKWQMQITIDGRAYAERTISPTERRRWTDLQIPVRRLIDEHEVGFRLSFEEA